MDLPVAVHLGDQPFRQRVHDRDADAVEPAGDLVSLAAELSARVKLGEDDGQRRELLLLHPVDRDAATCVADGDRVVGVNRDLDEPVVAGESLVDRVVDDLVHEVVEPTRARRADVHSGPEPDGFETLEDSDVFSGICGFGQEPPRIENACKTGIFRPDVSISDGRVGALRCEACGHRSPDRLAELEIRDRGCESGRLGELPLVRSERRAAGLALSSAGGSGTRPTAKRIVGGASSPSAATSFATTSSCRSVSSCAHVDEVVAT